MSTKSTVAVLGLGAMGSAIARTLAAQGNYVKAWNRTAKPFEEFGPGIELVESPEAAVSDADLVVVCVRDHQASQTLIDRLVSALVGRVVVNVSSGTPAEAVASAARTAELGVRYVTGAVMVPTSMVGTENSLVIYAGSAADIDAATPLFDALKGSSDIVGYDHAVPPALDLAMLDIYFAGMYAHLHATALARAYGIEPTRFLPYAQGILRTLGASLPGLTHAIDNRRYDGGQARLDMCLSFLEHIVTSSREAHIDPGLAEHVRAVSQRAMAEHPGTIDWDVVAEDFLVPSDR